MDTFEEEEEIDLEAVATALLTLENDMKATDKTIAGFCDELGIKAPFAL